MKFPGLQGVAIPRHSILKNRIYDRDRDIGFNVGEQWERVSLRERGPCVIHELKYEIT